MGQRLAVSRPVPEARRRPTSGNGTVTLRPSSFVQATLSFLSNNIFIVAGEIRVSPERMEWGEFGGGAAGRYRLGEQLSGERTEGDAPHTVSARHEDPRRARRADEG